MKKASVEIPSVHKNIACGICHKSHEVHERTKDSYEYKYFEFKLNDKHCKIMLCTDSCIIKACRTFMNKEAKCLECNGDLKTPCQSIIRTNLNVSYVTLYCSSKCSIKNMRTLYKENKETSRFTCNVCHKILESKPNDAGKGLLSCGVTGDTTHALDANKNIIVVLNVKQKDGILDIKTNVKKCIYH